MAMQAMGGYDLDSARLQLEVAKADLEKERLSVERARLQWTGLTLVVLVLAVSVLLGYGLWVFHAESSRRFQVDAARAVLQSGPPGEALGKAAALARMFPGQLPPDFTRSFLAPEFVQGSDTDSKIRLIALIAPKLKTKEEVIALWDRAFPDDAWAAERAAHD